MKSQRGSVTLEGAIAITITIAAVITISSFMRVVYIHGVIQNALIQTANEMSVYTYLYSMSGLDEINKATNAKTKGAMDAFSGDLDKMKDFYKDLMDISLTDIDSFNALQLPDIQMDEAFGNAGNAAIEAAYDTAKAAAFGKITRGLFKRYIPERENGGDFLANYGVVGGFDGLDFMDSRYFASKSPDSIHLVVCYELKYFAPIKIIDKLPMVQGAKTRCWFKSWEDAGGEPSDATPGEAAENAEDRGIWKLSNLERARAVHASLPAPCNNFAFTHPGPLSGFSEGTAYDVISVEMIGTNYTDNPSLLAQRFDNAIRDITNQASESVDGSILHSLNDIDAVTLFVYIPPDASESDKQAARSLAAEKSGKITLDDGPQVNLRIEVVEYQ